jgi:hypothetical protein
MNRSHWVVLYLVVGDVIGALCLVAVVEESNGVAEERKEEVGV